MKILSTFDYLKYLNNICSELMMDFHIGSENVNLLKIVISDVCV